MVTYLSLTASSSRDFSLANFFSGTLYCIAMVSIIRQSHSPTCLGFQLDFSSLVRHEAGQPELLSLEGTRSNGGVEVRLTSKTVVFNFPQKSFW